MDVIHLLIYRRIVRKIMCILDNETFMIENNTATYFLVSKFTQDRNLQLLDLMTRICNPATRRPGLQYGHPWRTREVQVG